jgi:hypothetical protein
MLSKNLFQPHEPRNMFPVFADCENRLAYVLRNEIAPKPGEVLRFGLRNVVKRQKRFSSKVLARVFVDSLRGVRVTFRGAFFTRDGKLVTEIPPFATLRSLQGFDISVNELLEKAGIPLQDGLFLLIADRGVKLVESFSTGTVSAVYSSPKTFSCYRNGIFARPVNELSHHKPQGFRSIAPHMFVSGDVVSSAFFCNFSSDPAYDQVANPTVRLYRDEKEFLEAKFGPIAPFGGAEKSMVELFGEEAEEFLRPTNGSGTLVAEESGRTLTSIHLIRNRKTGGMSIEHTRPTHMYVV